MSTTNLRHDCCDVAAGPPNVHNGTNLAVASGADERRSEMQMVEAHAHPSAVPSLELWHCAIVVTPLAQNCKLS